MMNSKKEGYSVPEVAQVLHLCTATIHNMINRGELGCNLYPEKMTPGKKRQMRITRAHIQEYMRSHRSKFTKEDLDAWGVDGKTRPTLPEADISEAYEARDLSELKGAWAGLAESNEAEISKIEEALNHAHVEPSKTEVTSYSLSIDGRIAVGNVEAKTVSAIVDALLHDSNISYDSISIKKGVCYK